MSLTSSAALVDSASDSSELGCEQSRSASPIPIAKPFSESTGQMSLFSETCENSTLTKDGLWPTPTQDTSNRKRKYSQGGKALILSVAASPAKTSASQERARALKALARDYGASSPELLAKFDRNTSSWRTSQLCLDGALAEFSETWPRSGMMRNGTAYQLPPLVPLTDEIGSGLWPTPVQPNGGRSIAHCDDIRETTAYHPGKKVQVDLNQAVKIWPTPAERDYRHPNAKPYSERGGGKKGEQLPNAVGGSLNPTWVEWLMGFPLGWTALEHWGIRSSRRSRKSSDGQ
jgi:hypothetical protein